MLLLKGGTLNKVPVLYCAVTNQNIKSLQRLQFAALYPKHGMCYLPAYSPILDFCLRDLKRVFPDYKVDERGQKIIEDYKKFIELYKKKFFKPDFDFVFKPYVHQTESLLDIIYNFRWNLNLDPGLGKTKIIIDYLRYLMKKTLIVAPSSLMENWIDEFETHSRGELKVTIFAEDVKPKRVTVYDENGEPLRDEKGKLVKQTIPAKKLKTEWLQALETDVLLVGYDSAERYQDEIAAYFDYDIMVLDESHRIKSFKGKNSVAARKLSQKAYRRVTMSGTYILNSPIDAWPQMNFLSPQILNKPFYTFRDEYCTFDKRYRHQVVGFKNMDKLNRSINRFSTRYTKEEAVDMPKRTVTKLFFELSPEQRKWTDDVLSEEDLIFNDGHITKDHKVTLLGKLAQICKGYVHLSNKDPKICDGCQWVGDCVENGVKPYTKMCNVEKKAPAPTVKRLKTNPALDMLKDKLQDILDADKVNKVIIWCSGVEELNIIEEHLIKEKIGYERVNDAKTTMTKVKKHNATLSNRVLLSSSATGIGYTTNESRYSFYFSNSFSLEHYLQSRDRNYRLTTKDPVWEYHFIGRNTIEVPTFEALEFKQNVVDTLLSNIDCNICPHKKSCEDAGVIIFGKGCKFQKKVSRKSIKI